MSLSRRQLKILLKTGRVHIVTSKNENGLHEVALSEAVSEVEGEITGDLFEEVKAMPGYRTTLLMFPGTAVFEALVHTTDVVARDYEVTVFYKNRPNDPLDLT